MSGVSYAEYDRYNSGNPYSAGKAGGEEFAVAYQNTYKVTDNCNLMQKSECHAAKIELFEWMPLIVLFLQMPIVVTHTMNVFGERQNPEKFIPGVLSAVMNGQQVGFKIFMPPGGKKNVYNKKPESDGG